MIYLLDTHTFLWFLLSPKELSKKVREIILDEENEIYISVISFWEIAIKFNLGKIKLHNVELESLPVWSEKAGLVILDLRAKEAASFYQLPKSHHKDPFDRMLIWQSIQNKMTLLTKDSDLKSYEKLGLKKTW